MSDTAKYFDRNNHRIYPGVWLKNIFDESICLVVKTQRADGEEDLGVSATNPVFLKHHPEWPEEFFPLCDIDLSEHEILSYDSYAAMAAAFRKHEAQNAELLKQGVVSESSLKHLTAHVIITEDSFTAKYSQESRTYVVSSNNKAFLPNMGGYSIFAGSVDGSDPCVRLSAYLACEKGPKDGWKVELCYPVKD